MKGETKNGLTRLGIEAAAYAGVIGGQLIGAFSVAKGKGKTAVAGLALIAVGAITGFANSIAAAVDAYKPKKEAT